MHSSSLPSTDSAMTKNCNNINQYFKKWPVKERILGIWSNNTRRSISDYYFIKKKNSITYSTIFLMNDDADTKIWGK